MRFVFKRKDLFMPKNILIVDDSPSVRKVVSFYLKNGGFQTTEAADGHAAMECLTQGNFDTIILDVNMPRMNGFAFLKAIKQDPAHAAVPVLMLTTEGREEERRQAMELGASDYFIKPFKPTELLAAVRRLAFGAE